MKTRLSVLLVLAAAACGYKPVKEGAPTKQPAYAFPHGTHADADVACNACHAGIAKATKLEADVRHVQIPANVTKQKLCGDCHDTEPKFKPAKRTREFRVRFDHAAHLKRQPDCKACHATLTEPGDAEAKTPPMAACTACHEHQREFAEARCMPCHVDLKGYEPVTAFKHDGAWLRNHGALARPSAASCAACHDQTYCVTCHSSATAPTRLENIFPERGDRGFIHRGDYVSRHAVDQAANPASCARCHGSGFCDSCHTLQGVTRRAGSIRDPHPPGWANDRASGNFHGDAARRNITSCAGCHDQGAASVCVGCHQVGGVAGKSPHPRRFVSSHDRGDISKNAMCRACHK